MEPLIAFGIAANVVQVALFATSLIQSIGRFVEQTKSVPDSIREVYDELRNLEEVLQAISETFEKRPKQLSFEYNHHDRIKRILESCELSLKDLDQALPELKDDTKPTEKLKLSIKKSLKEDRVQHILRHINSYTTTLQLSLQTLSLGESWLNRQSQEDILREVRKIHQDIRSTGLFSGRTDQRVKSITDYTAQGQRPDTPPSGSDQDGSILYKELRDWRETVDEVTAAVSLYNTDHNAGGGPLESSTTLPTLEHDISDSEDEELDEISRQILRLTIKNNQSIVSQLMQSEIYFQAAEYQRRGIRKFVRLNQSNTELSEGGSNTEYTHSMATMQETLVDILIGCETPQTDDEAEELLTRLLDEEISSVGTNDTDRECRLSHKLGSFYANQGNFRQSRRHLNRAFKGRSKANHEATRESAEQLIKTLQVLQLIDEARGVQEYLEERFPRRDGSTEARSSSYNPSPRTSIGARTDLTSPFQWCREKGFDVKRLDFGFDSYDDELGKTPIHQAIEDEDVGILQEMIQNVPHLKQLDVTGSTPVHVAAETCSKAIFSTLLEKDPDLDVLDQKSMTPLHRCQCKSGGVQVAEMILTRCPQLVDCVDCFDKTALYMACEKGNEHMVKFLLSKKANPNKPGSGRCIPLVSAIDAAAQSRSKIRIVSELLDFHADPRIHDVSGRNAFEAANNAGLAGGEIRQLLESASVRRSSVASSSGMSRTSSGGRSWRTKVS
ncbi:ankyrin [Xylariaceae sp. FL1272]|nr:ankyrin [Xylariaceae sp. FL1272]